MSDPQGPRPESLAGQILDLPELKQAWQVVEIGAGQTLFAQGDPGDAFYTLDAGSLEVFTADESGSRVVLERLGPGQHLGELSLVDGGERAAGATALTDCRLRKLAREDFLEALPRVPALAATTIALLGTRMRRNAEYIGYVSRWAQLVARGDYKAARERVGAEAADHEDPNIERFVGTFVEMIGSVQAREAKLKQELRALKQLQIAIDRSKYEQQLTEVTESDFFRTLQSNASKMRKRIRGAEAEDAETDAEKHDGSAAKGSEDAS